MIEKEISIESSGASLSGTLSLPTLEGSFPLVLMIHGSGPLDRNENTDGQKLDIFNAIAHALVASGIASVRYDKRGCFKSTGNYYCSSHRDFVADAVRWVEELHQSDFCCENGLYVLGHSEGTVIAPQVCSQTAAVAGLIFLCPLVSDFESILLRQARQLDKENASSGGWKSFAHGAMCAINRSNISRQIALIKTIKNNDANTIQIRGQTIAAKWCRDMLDLDLKAIYRKVTCPALLIGGGKDLQCDSRDVFKIEELCAGPVRVKVFPDLTHILRFDDQTPALTRYQKLIAKPVENEVVETIVRWIQCRRALKC